MTNDTTPTTPTVAVVTGGSRGLGRNTVLSLARRRVDTIFTYRTNREAAEKVVAEVEEAGVRAVAVQLDVADSQSFAAFADRVRTHLAELGTDQLDILVNNAGHGHHQLIADTSVEDFDQLFRVHLKAPFFLTQALLPVLADGGRIINISSGLTRFAMPGTASYAAMKGGVEVFTRYLALELGERGITVNTVAPGAIETDFSGGMVRDDGDVNAQVAAVTALGRAGVPDDIGPMIASLLSDDNRWVNAQRIEVSGGMRV